MYHKFSGDFLQWIHTFLAIFETHSIQRSAELLHLSPSSVSYQIRRLESELKEILFERTSLGMTPTQEAIQLKENILPILDAIERLQNKNSRPLTGTLRIACGDWLSHELALHILHYRELHPSVVFVLEVVPFLTVQKLVERGMVDLGITIYREFPGSLRFVRLRSSSAWLYTAHGNPYLLPHSPSWEQICTLPFISLTLDGYVNPVLKTIPGIVQPQNILFSTSSFLLALELVKRGKGVCIAPPLTPFKNKKDYTLFNIDHIFSKGVLGFLMQRQRNFSHLGMSFIQFLKGQYTKEDYS